jgi:hypothetical protein
MAVLSLLLFSVPYGLRLQTFLVHMLSSTWASSTFQETKSSLARIIRMVGYLYSFQLLCLCSWSPPLVLNFPIWSASHHTGDLKIKTVRFSGAGQGPPIGTLRRRPAGIMRWAHRYTSQRAASALKMSVPAVALTFGSLIFQTQRL